MNEYFTLKKIDPRCLFYRIICLTKAKRKGFKNIIKKNTFKLFNLSSSE